MLTVHFLIVSSPVFYSDLLAQVFIITKPSTLEKAPGSHTPYRDKVPRNVFTQGSRGRMRLMVKTWMEGTGALELGVCSL